VGGIETHRFLLCVCPLKFCALSQALTDHLELLSLLPEEICALTLELGHSTAHHTRTIDWRRRATVHYRCSPACCQRVQPGFDSI
jgi:hypothetical protein